MAYRKLVKLANMLVNKFATINALNSEWKLRVFNHTRGTIVPRYKPALKRSLNNALIMALAQKSEGKSVIPHEKTPKSPIKVATRKPENKPKRLNAKAIKTSLKESKNSFPTPLFITQNHSRKS